MSGYSFREIAQKMGVSIDNARNYIHATKEFSTQEVIQKYRLGSSANVATVKRALIKKELIETEKREVTISDPLLKVWLQRELL